MSEMTKPPCKTMIIFGRSWKNLNFPVKKDVRCSIVDRIFFNIKNRHDCHDFSMTVMNLSNFFVLNIKGVDYRVYISGTDKKDAVNILKNSDLCDKGVL